jgi:hypothetical protein
MLQVEVIIGEPGASSVRNMSSFDTCTMTMTTTTTTMMMMMAMISSPFDQLGLWVPSSKFFRSARRIHINRIYFT